VLEEIDPISEKGTRMTIAQVANRNVLFRRVGGFGLLTASVLGVALFSQSARADPPVSLGEAPRDVGIPTSEERKLPQVTVQARRQLERRINEFVRKITNVPFSFQDSLPLWHDPLCFAVAGLPTVEGLSICTPNHSTPTEARQN
jgi:hypothetical protein